MIPSWLPTGSFGFAYRFAFSEDHPSPCNLQTPPTAPNLPVGEELLSKIIEVDKKGQAMESVIASCQGESIESQVLSNEIEEASMLGFKMPLRLATAIEQKGKELAAAGEIMLLR